MSDAGTDGDELAEIRERKLAELEARIRGTAEDGTGDAAEPTDSTGAPSRPVPVDGTAEFDRAVAANDVVLADFHAEWCGPCEMLEPAVESLAARTDAFVAKVDVDENGELAARYGVRGVPTLLLFANGRPVERIVGVRDEASLVALVERYAR
jgi:thioredoxin 1